MTSSSCVLRVGTKGGPRVSGSDPIACLPACVSPWAFLFLRGLTQAHAPGLGEKTGLRGWEAVRGATPPRHLPKKSRSSSAKSCHCHLVWVKNRGSLPEIAQPAETQALLRPRFGFWRSRGVALGATPPARAGCDSCQGGSHPDAEVFLQHTRPGG